MLNRQSRHYPWVLLAVLSVAYISASVDRIVISLLVDPIKADLGLTDTEISLLLGLAYVLVFSVAGLFMGILVDTLRRTRLLSLGIGFWNAMTVACGLSNSFLALFLSRTGLGIGQAVLTPAAYSLISDSFDKKRLGLALGIFTTGGAIGTGLSLILGGLAIGALSKDGDYHLPVLGTLHPWQLIFVIVAIPGFLVAAICAALPEPPRKTEGEGRAGANPLNAIGRYYRSNAWFLTCDHVAAGMSSLALLGAYSWIAPLLVRLHDWDPAAVGYWVGFVSLIGAPVGLLGGGALGDYLTARGAQARLWICAVSAGLAALFGAIYPLLADPEHLILAFGIMAMFATVPMGVGIAALQHVLPGEIRGKVSALYFFTVSGIGMIGPTLIAAISDAFFAGDSGIAYVTAMVIPASMGLAALMWALAVPPYRRILSQQKPESSANYTGAPKPIEISNRAFE